MRGGVTMTSTLLAKDTSHRTVFPVFAKAAAWACREMEGAGNFVHGCRSGDLPRAAMGATTPAGCCATSTFPNGKPVPFSTRRLYRDALAMLAKAGFDYFAGPRGRIPTVQARGSEACAGRTLTWPAEAPGGRAHHARLSVPDRVALRPGRSDHRGAAPAIRRRSACRCARSRVELGPEPIRVHLRAAGRARGGRHDGAVPQRHEAGGAAARLIASFMCRPRLPNTFASGWHLHQSLLDRKSRRTVRLSDKRVCSRRSAARFSPACSRMRARRRPSPRRRSTATSAITASTRWRRSRRSGRSDNRGVMIRVLGDRATRDASGEPRRRAARQSVSLHGVADHRRPRRHRAQARSRAVGRRALRGASRACRSRSPRRSPRCAQHVLPRGFGDAFVDYFVAIKDAEIARFQSEVTEWEQREYFDIM